MGEQEDLYGEENRLESVWRSIKENTSISNLVMGLGFFASSLTLFGAYYWQNMRHQEVDTPHESRESLVRELEEELYKEYGGSGASYRNHHYIEWSEEEDLEQVWRLREHLQEEETQKYMRDLILKDKANREVELEGIDRKGFYTTYTEDTAENEIGGLVRKEEGEIEFVPIENYLDIEEDKEVSRYELGERYLLGKHHYTPSLPQMLYPALAEFHIHPGSVMATNEDIRSTSGVGKRNEVILGGQIRQGALVIKALMATTYKETFYLGSYEVELPEGYKKDMSR